ncbi:MAG: hypothetical protein ACREYC_20385 [Gammaproteobacteria bacterium]
MGQPTGGARVVPVQYVHARIHSFYRQALLGFPDLKPEVLGQGQALIVAPIRRNWFLLEVFYE